MILTVKDDYDKEKGTGLPMFSRPGKSTITSYLAFDQPGKHQDDGLEVVDSDEDNEEMAINLGDEKKTDIAREIRKITEYRKHLAL
jgi:hypothetical protein